MSNFALIKPVDIALAMQAPTANDAVEQLSRVAQHKPAYSIDCDVHTWLGTGLPVRHGLLMEWFAAECMA